MTGPQLKALRYKLGLSLAQASEQIGVSPRTWCRWESGESRIRPYFVMVFKMLNKVK